MAKNGSKQKRIDYFRYETWCDDLSPMNALLCQLNWPNTCDHLTANCFLRAWRCVSDRNKINRLHQYVLIRRPVSYEGTARRAELTECVIHCAGSGLNEPAWRCRSQYRSWDNKWSNKLPILGPGTGERLVRKRALLNRFMLSITSGAPEDPPWLPWYSARLYFLFNALN